MKSVLVAETHAPTLELLQQVLSQAGYRVLSADEPANALEQCVTERPDAVIIAVDLPRLHGSTLGKLVRATDLGARLPLLAIDKAHLGRAKGVSAVLELMVNAYVADPTRSAELLSRLEQLIAAASQAPRPTSGIAATLSRSPVITGELKSRALPLHAHSWYRLARDGVLVAVQGELTRRVFFMGGAPINYESTARQDSLGRYLVAQGELDGAQYEELLAAMRDGLSEGAALVAIGAVEAGEPLLAKLRAYTRAKVAETYAMTSGRFSFYAGTEFSSEVPSMEIPALAPIYEAARASWPVRSFSQALAPHMKSHPSRTPEFGQQLGALGLGTADLKLALAIDGRTPLRALLAQGRDLKHAYALYWYLTTVGLLRFSDTPAASAAPAGFELAEKARGSARRRKPLPEEQLRSLRDEAVRVLTSSYFRALHLDITADSEDVERAYHDLATRFHPDFYPDHDTAPIEDLLASVQERISAAYRVLSDPEKRKNYVNYLLTRSEVTRTSTPVVDAEIALKRGEKLMKKGDWKGALVAFETAVSLNAREPEYYSYLAWATWKAGSGTKEQRVRAANRWLKKGLAMNPTLERPQVIAAILEDELGDPGEARRMLLKVLKANPNSELAKKALQGLSRRHGAGEKI